MLKMVNTLLAFYSLFIAVTVQCCSDDTSLAAVLIVSNSLGSPTTHTPKFVFVWRFLTAGLEVLWWEILVFTLWWSLFFVNETDLTNVHLLMNRWLSSGWNKGFTSQVKLREFVESVLEHWYEQTSSENFRRKYKNIHAWRIPVND